jgi:hypothetical protein
MRVSLCDHASRRSCNAALYSSRCESTHADSATCWRAVGRNRNTYARLMPPSPPLTNPQCSGAPWTPTHNQPRSCDIRRRRHLGVTVQAGPTQGGPVRAAPPTPGALVGPTVDTGARHRAVLPRPPFARPTRRSAPRPPGSQACPAPYETGPTRTITLFGPIYATAKAGGPSMRTQHIHRLRMRARRLSRCGAA